LIEPNKLKELRKRVLESVHSYSEEFERVKQRKDVPVSGKKIGEEEFEAATNAILDGWWTDGPYANKFEKMLCDYIGVSHSCFVNSGSSANLLALTALTSLRMGKKRIKNKKW